MLNTENYLNPAWRSALEDVLKSPEAAKLGRYLAAERSLYAVYPPEDETFAALNAVNPQDIRVILVGADPYHGPHQAHGLSFSVMPDIRIPPSLRNIYKELQSDLGHEPASHGHLSLWAQQGVLMLNDVLTVRHKSPGSHKGEGWEAITDAVVQIANDGPPSVFILWGKNAQLKAASINTDRHCIIASTHPSPMGGSCYKGFFGSRPFSRANAFLKEIGRGEIDWKIPENV